MPKKKKSSQAKVGKENSVTRERQALRRIVRHVEEWVDNGRKRHETTLLRVLNTALGVL